MAKPDLQAAYVAPDTGQLRRLDGKLGLELGWDNLQQAANDGAAAALDPAVPVGGIYINTGTGAVTVRLV